MEIIGQDKLKKLQNLFSWSYFYNNYPLEVDRRPSKLLVCKWSSSSAKLETYKPFEKVIANDKRQADKIQQDIIKLSNSK